MATKLAKFLLVWIAIPAFLALLGYYVIGPRIGQVPPSQTADGRAGERARDQDPNVVAHENEVKPRKYAEPTVDVKVERSTPQRSSAASTRKRGSASTRTTRPSPPEDAPAPSEPPTDDGGSGGVGLDGGA